MWERSRFEWRPVDGGDPATEVTAFLARYGLGVPPRPQDRRTAFEQEHSVTDICGATLLVSAAGCAAMTGTALPAGAPTPAPAVPDVVAIVYSHVPPAPVRPVPAGARVPAPARTRASLAAPGGRVFDGQASGPAAGDPWTVGPWRPSWSRADYADAVRAVRAAIARGDVYQVNLVGHASAPYQGDPLPALRRVAALPGARYPEVVTGAGWAVACASPETLVEVVGDRVTTRPIKGTAPATAAGRAHLLASVKERAEHVMIVDLERNDLAHVAVTGSVEVSELYGVRRWCDLWQAESCVDARLRPGVDLAALLRAVCPGGSVTGAPKVAALGQIAALEPVGRGPSMGALGWIGRGGLDLGLTIRTVAADADRLHLWAGGGITWDSDPLAEVAEAAAKAAPIRAALASA